jgi:hypothetical protein
MDPGVEAARFQEVFLHLIAPWVLQRLQWECLHASAVLTDCGVVAFCGPSGRGKSTIARAYGELGAITYADDALPWLLREGAAMAACLPQRLRLRGPAASWFADSPAAGSNGARIQQVRYELEPSLRPLAGLYWLEPMLAAGQAPRWEPVPPAEAFRLLLSQAYSLNLSDQSRNHRMVRNYLDLAHSQPVFRLRFPPGLDQLPELVDRLRQHQRDRAQRG